jgi:hypothetical protein
MALVDTITRVQAKGNDIKRRLLMSPGQRCFGLKRAGETKRFTAVLELTTGWNLRWSEFRGQPVLEIAAVETDPDSPTFRDAFAQMTHWAIGVPDGTGAINEVYAMDPERKDVKPPTVDNVFWKVYLTPVVLESYTPA